MPNSKPRGIDCADWTATVDKYQGLIVEGNFNLRRSVAGAGDKQKEIGRTMGFFANQFQSNGGCENCFHRVGNYGVRASGPGAHAFANWLEKPRTDGSHDPRNELILHAIADARTEHANRLAAERERLDALAAKAAPVQPPAPEQALIDFTAAQPAADASAQRLHDGPSPQELHAQKITGLQMRAAGKPADPVQLTLEDPQLQAPASLRKAKVRTRSAAHGKAPDSPVHETVYQVPMFGSDDAAWVTRIPSEKTKVASAIEDALKGRDNGNKGRGH